MAEGILRPHPGDHLERLLPHRARQLGVDPEAGLLVLAGAAGPELEPAVGEDVERGGALGDADRVVEAIRQEHDAVPDADLPCPLRDGREEDLGRGGVGELREEVVLDRPHGVEAEPVGERDLLERLVVTAVLAARVVRLGDLELVEQVELHRRRPAVLMRRCPPVVQAHRAVPAVMDMASGTCQVSCRP